MGTREAEGVAESVLFEVADFALCLQLCNRLDQDWDAHVVGRTESHFVAVGIDPDDGRMELLLDAVAAWAWEAGLRSVMSARRCRWSSPRSRTTPASDV